MGRFDCCSRSERCFPSSLKKKRCMGKEEERERWREIGNGILNVLLFSPFHSAWLIVTLHLTAALFYSLLCCTLLHTTSLHYTLPHSTTHYLTPLHSSWMSSYVCPFLFLLAPRPFSDPRLHTYQLLVQSLSTYMPFSSATFSLPCKIDFKLMMIWQEIVHKQNISYDVKSSQIKLTTIVQVSE